MANKSGGYFQCKQTYQSTLPVVHQSLFLPKAKVIYTNKLKNYIYLIKKDLPWVLFCFLIATLQPLCPTHSCATCLE